MNISAVAGTVAIPLVSRVAGHVLGRPDSVSGAVTHGIQATHGDCASHWRSSSPTHSLIARAADGNVTLRVDPKPLEWGLERIAAWAPMPKPGEWAQRHACS